MKWNIAADAGSGMKFVIVGDKMASVSSKDSISFMPSSNPKSKTGGGKSVTIYGFRTDNGDTRRLLS